MKTRIFILGLAMLMLAVFVDAQGTKRRGATGAAVAKTIRIDLSKEKVGSESAKFLSVVGNWVIVEDGGKKCLAVDGRQWMRGQPAGGLAQKARETRAEMPIVYTSGLGVNDGMKALFVEPFLFLPKPYTAEQLVKTIKYLLLKSNPREPLKFPPDQQ